MTRDEKRHLDKVQGLGCMAGACTNMRCGAPAEIHHIRTGKGMAQRATHFEVIPLCPDHHRNGGYGVALHAGQQAWESIYGSELDLLNEVQRRLERLK